MRRSPPISRSPSAATPRRWEKWLHAVSCRCSAIGEPAPYKEGSGRAQLAQAIASESNPLTARVMVNRIWQYHFGKGIVRTPSNFGRMGERPTHPELLDYLAADFIANGWSIKKLHRKILLSSTYGQATGSQPGG